jgi:N-methylhydantoinase B
VALDPITLEVLSNRLQEIVATMEHLLFHSGYSTILRESYDGSAGITDHEGHPVIGSGMPGHLPPYHITVEGVLAQYPIAAMRDGDSFVMNDPYWGGTAHSPDLAIVTPVFWGGRVIAFCVSIAHKPDIGGMVPGSAAAGAREVYHEGLLLPGVRYWTAEGIVPEIDAIIRRNSRQPEVISGDLRAQVGCTRTGATKLGELCDEYGGETMLGVLQTLQDLSELRMRRGLAAWPDGEAEGEVQLAPDGVVTDVEVRFHVRVVKQGDGITLDFSGCSPSFKGPQNLRPQSAEAAAMLAMVSYVDPTIPVNYGCRRAIELVFPEGSVVNPRFPTPVGSYFASTVMLYSAILKALARFNPERAVASMGFGTSGPGLGYRRGRAGKPLVQYEILVPSMGASSATDGAFVVTPMGHITPNTPVEILETEFPVRVERFEPRIDSAGPGYNRGGLGYRKRYRTLTDAVLNFRRMRAQGVWGVFGGGAPGEPLCSVNPETEAEESLRFPVTRDLPEGETVEYQGQGGGGYGDPFTREPERVLEDVLNGYVSPDRAAADYGVAIDPSRGTVDAAATARLRARAAVG